jgi:cytidyltransferase-like protein
MDIKPYDLALYIGRFQLIHIGHCAVIDTALKICDRVLILVGSAQESNTIENPFDISTRINLIKEIYGDRVLVYPINDTDNKKDVSENWTKFLMDTVKRYVGKLPDLVIFGDEQSNGWFTDDEMKDTMRIVVPRNRIPISATKMREYMVRNDIENWFKYSDPKLHKHYFELRGKLLLTEPYRIAFNNLIKANYNVKGWQDYGVESYTRLNFGEYRFDEEQIWD